MLGRYILIASVLLVMRLSAPGVVDGADPDDVIDSLIEQLGSSRWSEREAASKALKEMGFKAFPHLEKALTHDNPEIRMRAKELFKGNEFYAALKAPWPKCYHAAERALAAAGDCVNTDPVQAVRLYEAAVNTYPYFLNSHDVRAAFKLALEKAPQATRESYLKTGPGLYLMSQYKAYVAEHPKGIYAPYAQYCAITGYDTYFVNWRTDRTRGKVAIKDPDAEIAAWSQYLKDYPTFKGCDDANYRLARALEKKGLLAHACLQYRMKHPDGDMKFVSLERMQFIMETRMDAKAIMNVLTMALQAKTPPDKLLLGDLELQALCPYLCAMKLYYAQNFVASARAFKVVMKLPVGTSAFAMNIRKQATTRAAFSDKAAELAKDQTADGLYAYASHIYKHAGRTFLANVVTSPDGRSSYDAREPADFFRRRTRFWQSAQVYQQILEKHPGADITPKTLYMLGNCYCHLAEKYDAFWRPQLKDNVRKAILYYEKVASDHPKHDLAPAATKAAAKLRKNWRIE